MPKTGMNVVYRSLSRATKFYFNFFITRLCSQNVGCLFLHSAPRRVNTGNSVIKKDCFKFSTLKLRSASLIFSIAFTLDALENCVLLSATVIDLDIDYRHLTRTAMWFYVHLSYTLKASNELV